MGQQQSTNARLRRLITSIQGIGGTHRGSPIPCLGVTEEGSNDLGGEIGEQRHRAEQMPARDGEQQYGASQREAVGCQQCRSFNSKVLAKGGVRCKRTEPEGGREEPGWRAG